VSKLITFFLLLNSFTLFSQTIVFQGKVKDSTGTPLLFANVIADPEENISIEFSISDETGYYKLNLKKGNKYHITISYLGFIPKTYEVIATQDTTKDFILKESTESLKEVTLKYTSPVVIKEDTITYKVDAFLTGGERKLKDILKKLPAVEVDRAGNVTVQGKRVTKVLVENEEFFTGDSKLAVNNIPADVVDQIEVLDNFNKVGFLKNLEDSKVLAMNIKLKKDKNKFSFGEIEIGGGVKNRYLIHPSLYYYSPKTSINLIADFNNIGIKSFTVKDYLDFEGGRNKILMDAKSYFSLINDDFAKFLSNTNFKENQNKFGALSLTQKFSLKTKLTTYGIWSQMKVENETQILNDYVINGLKEIRSIKGQKESQFGIGKLMLEINPNKDIDITFGSYIKASRNKSVDNIYTLSLDNSNSLNTSINAKNISFKQDIQWHRFFNKKHTTSAVFNYNYQKATPDTNWLTDKSILQGLIPLIDEDEYNINKIKTLDTQNIDFVVKHYWVLNRFNHIYFNFGNLLAIGNHESFEYQLLQDDSINDFSSAGFGNNAKLNFNDLFFGVFYKTQRGIFTLKPGVLFHNYNWNISQFNEKTKNNKSLLLPEIKAKAKFSQSKNLLFEYKLKARFPNLSQFSNRFTLMDFNSVYRGNEKLENELYHLMQLKFYRFNIHKNLFYNLRTSYRIKGKNFKNTMILQGIDYVSSPILSDFEDKVWNLRGSFSKVISKYKISLRGSISKANYEKPINNTLIPNSINNFLYGGGVKTNFKNLPNVELNYSRSISEYQSTSHSTFQSDVFSFYIDYIFLRDFVFKADYSYEKYRNQSFNNSNTFNLVNASLFYQKENSPWGFEIYTRNLFDVPFKRRNSFTSFLVSDEKTYIFPRIIMFKVNFKL